MDPLSALGLACNIIQIVDFSARIISRGHELYTSPNGTLQEHDNLKAAAKSLSELSLEMRNFNLAPLSSLSLVDKQLVQLSKDAKAVATKLTNALEQTKVDGSKRG